LRSTSTLPSSVASRAFLSFVRASLARPRRGLDQLGGGCGPVGHQKEGDILDSGRVVAEVAVREGFRFEATVPSEEVGHLRVGMPDRYRGWFRDGAPELPDR
jgi:hypothetical protein